MPTLVNTKAPDFSLKDQNGKIHTLSDYSGRKVLLYFYPKDNTPGCTKQACSYSILHKEFEKYNTVIIEITKEVSTALHENGFAELRPQLEQSAKYKLEDAVNDVQKKIHSTLAELEIAVHIDDPKIMELKIDGSGMTKGTAKNTPGKYADNMTKFGGVAEKGVGAVAGIAKEEATKRSWWQFWKKAPDIGGKGTVLYHGFRPIFYGRDYGKSDKLLVR